ncbi:hypothetical protein QWZ13_07280 [Reinekea marina]|uniref:hypothetical protein n=1 Tax=Reinekea marina TaxID=1310421 RepID=UPI0025B3103A|nr:hypothetical protein [Reinekea marina]MDN3648715.1 hypothetical protein [Reinekea marina]
MSMSPWKNRPTQAVCHRNWCRLVLGSLNIEDMDAIVEPTAGATAVAKLTILGLNLRRDSPGILARY